MNKQNKLTCYIVYYRVARIGLSNQVRIAYAKFLFLPFMLLPPNKTGYLGGLSIKALMNKD